MKIRYRKDGSVKWVDGENFEIREEAINFMAFDERFKWIAINRVGTVIAYTEKPKLTVELSIWMRDSLDDETKTVGFIRNMSHLDWKKSLRRINQ